MTSDPYKITGPTVSHNFTFTNTPFGTIKAEKINGATGQPMTGWQMTLQYQKTNGNWADATDANLVTGTITNPQGCKATWDNLKLGTYKVVEETKAG